MTLYFQIPVSSKGYEFYHTHIFRDDFQDL